jgi:hypothetical protein
VGTMVESPVEAVISQRNDELLAGVVDMLQNGIYPALRCYRAWIACGAVLVVEHDDDSVARCEKFCIIIGIVFSWKVYRDLEFFGVVCVAELFHKS